MAREEALRGVEDALDAISQFEARLPALSGPDRAVQAIVPMRLMLNFYVGLLKSIPDDHPILVSRELADLLHAAAVMRETVARVVARVPHLN